MHSNGHSANLHFAQTEDGWQLALHRYAAGKKPSNRPPVVLIPGLGSNRHNMDFPIPRYSLARFLYGLGYDVWAVDLRGMGLSTRPGLLNRWRYDWNFDDYACKDVPAIYRTIKEVTHRESFHWIGHSLGGMLVLAAIERLGNQAAASAVTVASCVSAEDAPGFIKNLMQFDAALKYLPLIPAKQIAWLAAPVMKWIAPFYDNFYCRLDNMAEEVLKLGPRVAVDNVPVKLVLQIHAWYRENHFRAVDGSGYSYLENLEKITAPLMMIAGAADGMTPVHDIRVGYDKVHSRPKKLTVFGKDHGHKSEYSHVDLLLGKNAPDEVYPVIADWIGRFNS